MPPGGRGMAPVHREEDRDLQRFAKRKVATQGPPALLTSRGRGGRGSGRGRGRGRGGGRGGSVGSASSGGGRSDMGWGGLPPSLSTAPMAGPSSAGPSRPSNARQPPPLSSPQHFSPRYPIPDRPRADRWPPSSPAPAPMNPIDYRHNGYRDHQSYSRAPMPDRSYQPNPGLGTYRPRSPPSPRSPEARSQAKRYSPSHPVLEDTWSPRPLPLPPSGPSRPEWNSHLVKKDDNPYPSFPSAAPSSSTTHPALPQTTSFDLPTESTFSRGRAASITERSTSSGFPRQHIVFGSTPPMPEPPLAGPSRIAPPSSSAQPTAPSGARWTTDSQPESSIPFNPPLPAAPEAPNTGPPAPPPLGQQEEIKRRKFKPTIPGKKDKGKQREQPEQPTTLQPEFQPQPQPQPYSRKQREEVRVKAEPDVEGASSPAPAIPNGQMVDREGDTSIEDVKPDIQALEEEMNVRDVDWVQQSGALAISKRDLPPRCFSKDLAVRQAARQKVKITKTKALAAQGRKMTGTHWRDDGVAYDWTLLSGRDEEEVMEVDAGPATTSATEGAISASTEPGEPPAETPSQDTAPQVIHVEEAATNNTTAPSSPTTSYWPVMADQWSESAHRGDTTVADIDGISTAANSTAGDKDAQSSSVAQAEISDVIPDHPALPPEAIGYRRLGERGYSYLVECPPEFSTPQQRLVSPQFSVWKDDQLRLATPLDASGQPVCRAMYTAPTGGHNTIRIQVIYPQPGLPETWPDHLFLYERCIYFPPEWQSPKARAATEDEVRSWIENYSNGVSKPDKQGRPTCWVRADRKMSTVIFRWKPKTQEEIEAYAGPPVEYNSAMSWAASPAPPTPAEATGQAVQACSPNKTPVTHRRKPSRHELAELIIVPSYASEVSRDHTGVSYVIPLPAHIDPDAQGSPAYQDWLKEQLAVASLVDDDGMPTYRTTYKVVGKDGGPHVLKIRVLPYDPYDASTWPKEVFPYKVSVDYPEEWQYPRARESAKAEVGKWMKQQVDSISPRDGSGRQLRWTKVWKISTGVDMLWRGKTQEELKQGHRIISYTNSSNRVRRVGSPSRSQSQSQAPTEESALQSVKRGTEGKGKVVEVPRKTMFDHEEVFAFPYKWTDVSQEEQPDAEIEQWIAEQSAVVSAPDEKGRATRWINPIRRANDVLIRWRAKTQEEIEDDLPRRGSGSGSGSSQAAPAGRAAGPPATPTPNDNAKKRRLKQARHDAKEEALANSPKINVKIDNHKPPKAKKRKTGRGTDANNVPVRNRSESQSTTASTLVPATTPAPAPTPAQASNSSTTPAGVHARTPQASSSKHNPPVQVQVQAQAPPSPLAAKHNARPAPSPSLMTPATIAKRGTEPEPDRGTTSSPHLDALNASLRQKVTEIEKWTGLIKDYPDLASALGDQVLRTQGEIFGLHDAIREEKKRSIDGAV